jgi:integrase
MPRRVKDATLDTREARGKLKPRGKPYWRLIEPGLHIGYRRLKGRAGSWSVRHYLGEQAYKVEPLGVADDLSDADGVAILSYWHAQQKAREQMVARAHTAAGKHGPLTVGDAMDSYIEFLESHRKSASDVRYCDSSVIRPRLGDMLVADLTTEGLQRWHADIAKAPARLRTRPGAKQNHRALSTDPESKRQRQNTANRQLVMFKAALNRAWRDGKVASNAAWQRVQPFRGVDAARARYLTVAEAQRLVNSCDPDFRALVQAALATGARYGELAALAVHDFNPDTGTIHVRTSKSGKGRHIVLADEGVGLFTRLCTGRAGNELMLLKANGTAWRKSHQRNPMRDACARAHIKPAMGFHGLRHTWASLAVMNGVPLMVVAKNLGHRDTRMVERHYGHLAPSYIADAIRAGAPKFGFKPDRKVAALPR